MKEKIIAELKTAYAKLGLSDEAFDGVASLLEKTVKEESEIATAISGDDVKTLLTTIQGNVDSWKNKFYDTKKDLDEYKKNHPEEDPNKEDEKKKKESEATKKLQEQIEALTARLDQQDKAEKRKATLLAAEQSAKAAGCTDERALKLTSKLFSIKDDESDEDVAKRFKEEYDANIKEFFGDGAVPYRGARISTPTTVSAADKAKQAREDAKRVREG